MQPLTIGITKAGTGLDGIVWNILGQTYVPKQVSEHSFAWHATFPPTRDVNPRVPMPRGHGAQERAFAHPTGCAYAARLTCSRA
jgi:hypothetical protein